MKKTLFLTLVCAVFAAFSQDPDRSETPFIESRDEDGKQTILPLKEIDVKADIAGTIADVISKQVYVNDSKSTIQANYVFPASTKAAVYAMKMKVGDREVVAQIMKNEEAQETFDKAIEEGKTASLLEQRRPNVFEMSLGNIQPGDKIEIELKYTELLVPSEGVYEFVYPTIVGERYDQEVHKNESWISNSYAHLDQGNTPDFQLPTFHIEATIMAPINLHGVNVSSHPTTLKYSSKKEARITLDNGGKTDNKDFVLRYKLRGDKINTGLMLFEGEDENFFLYMGQAPERVRPQQTPARDYFFVVDVSGSMSGFPMDIAEEVMTNLLTGLNPEDRFNVMLFASSSSVLANEPLAVTSDNVEKAIQYIHNGSSGGAGGTNMLSALKRAFEQTKTSSSTSMVILTDGFISVEEEAFNYITDHIGEANFFPIGIGTSVNRHLIEGIAHVGHSEPLVISTEEEITRKANWFRKYINTPVLTDIDIAFTELEAYDIIPEHVPDLLAEKPVVIYGKWKGEIDGDIVLTGRNGEGKFESKIPVTKKSLSNDNQALRYLWARKKIQLLDDYNSVTYGSELADQITALGLKYNLLTDYTSFVAVDELKREPVEEVKPQHQPSGAVPEPHEWLLLILIFGTCIYFMRDKILKLFIR